MYPSQFFNLFPPFPRNQKVFVAMSFAPQFNARWEKVIAPGIRRIRMNDKPLEPYRVDIRQVSDSILTEILDGISTSLLVVADVTSIGKIDGNPVPNGNVMYEVGIAHAVRLPEEVIMLRSDTDSLLFDLRHVRVKNYNPDNDPQGAQNLVSELAMSTLKEIDLKRHLAVRRAADSLDYLSWVVLAESQSNEIIHPEMKTMGQTLGKAWRNTSISRLLELGALQTKYIEFSPDVIANIDKISETELMKYRTTPFGVALFEEVARRMKVAENQESLSQVFDPAIKQEMPDKKS